ncbi:MAG: leucine-rich repeat domain-containing protein, partial [Alphaproteobacteria bacterium]|nr:leucine-rich repeat domain-containing protein [Alphaproteobacteria bacterium]
PEVGLRVLEALKLYLNVKQLIFVIGVDREVVEDLVNKHYQNLGLAAEKSVNYLAKMFQVEATVAPSDPQIDLFLDSMLSENPAWREFNELEQEIFRTVIRQLAAESPREIKRLVNSALMAGAGARMSMAAHGAAAEPITPAQGTQVFLVRKVLETPKYTLGSLVGRNQGTAFFIAWSETARAVTAPSTISVSEDLVKRLKEHHQDRKMPKRERGSERSQEIEPLLSDYPEQYHALLTDPSFADFLHLLDDEALAALMRIAYPKEAAIFGGIAADTTSLGLILEAIARALSIEIEEVTPAVLDQVTDLNLRGTEVTDLDILKRLTRLQSLSLTDTQVADLDPLKGLNNLQSLSLERTRVVDLVPLKEILALQEVRLDGAPVADIEPLKNCTKLKRLDLDYTEITDFNPLKSLKNLETLYLSGTQIDDLEPLAGLTSLDTLSLTDTPITDFDMLKRFTNLHTLDLSYTSITDFQLLKDLANLETLYLADTQIADLIPLRGLSNLEYLDLGNTQVTDLKPLKSTTKLDYLNLSGTNVSDDMIARLKAELPNLEIEM